MTVKQQTEEIWRDCVGYEGKYRVSNLGRVWSIRSKKCLKPVPNIDGYLTVHLYNNNGKHRPERIHRLVAAAFIPNPYDLPDVNHKDEDKTNNRLENLEFCTPYYNINYGNHNKNVSMSRIGIKLTEEHKQKIRETREKPIRCIDLNRIFCSIKKAGEELQIDSANIGACIHGRRKTAGGYHWESVD